MRWHNEYNVQTLQRPGLEPFTSPEDAFEKTAGGENRGLDHRHARRSRQNHQEA